MGNRTERFFVVTGGPGSGKSSLISELEKRCFARSIEAGRSIIQDQVTIGGRALPWDDRQLFAELMLSWEMRSYSAAQLGEGTVFFDRGVPDVIGYLRLCQLPVLKHMKIAAETFRYNSTVFIAPPWQEIFHQDRERKQDFEEAIQTYDALVETYQEQNYSLVELPRLPLDQRVNFVLDTVDALLDRRER